MADIPSTSLGLCQKWKWEISPLLLWTVEEPAASRVGKYCKVVLVLRAEDVKPSEKFSRMKKITRT